MFADAPTPNLRPHRTTRVRSLTIDHDARTAAISDGGAITILTLTFTEFELLCALAADPGRVLRKQDLLRTIWNNRSPYSTRTLDTHACRLRCKLRAAGAEMLVTVWGVGYRLTDPW